MKIEYSSEVVYDLIRRATLAAQERFREALQEGDFRSINSRVDLLKGFGTIRIAIGRQAGHTTAAIKFANDFFEGNGHRTMYFGPSPERFEELGAPEAHRWTTATSQDPTGVRAIFVDPGPHAGSKARDAIYQYAAEAMRSEEAVVPVFVYFIGS